MRITRKYHHVLVFLVVCNSICCTTSRRVPFKYHYERGLSQSLLGKLVELTGNISMLHSRKSIDMNPPCKRAEDINWDSILSPTCNFNDLDDDVLIDICKRVGVKESELGLTRKDRISAASSCLQYEHLQSPEPLWEGIEELSDEALIDICKKVGHQHETGITRDELLISAKMCKVVDVEQIDNLYSWKQRKAKGIITEYVKKALKTEVLLQRLYQNYRDILAFGNTLDTKLNRMDYLFSKHKLEKDVETTMRQLVWEKFEQDKSYRPTPEEIAKLAKWSMNEQIVGTEGHTKLFQKDGSIVAAKYEWSAEKESWSEPIRIMESHYENGLDGWDVLDMVKISIWYNYYLTFTVKGRMAIIGYNDDADPVAIAQNLIDKYDWDEKLLVPLTAQVRPLMGKTGYGPTPDEIGKLSKWNPNKLQGIHDGQFQLFQKAGRVVGSQWNANNRTWTTPINFSELDYKDGVGRLDILDLVRKSIQYEHALTFAHPSLEGEKKIVIVGYNYGDDPHVAVQRVIDEYKLDATYMDLFARLIREIEEAINQQMGRQTNAIPEAKEKNPKGTSSSFIARPTAEETAKLPEWNSIKIGGLIRGLFRDANTLRRFSAKEWLGAVAVVYIVGAVIISMLNTGGRNNHRQFTKKTVYVKSSATKRLNQGKRLNGIVTRSGVQYIDFERKTGQTTAMYKIKSSNGEVYVPVNMKGSAEAIEKAIASIKIVVGTENLDEEIELPPTNIQQASANTEQVTAAPSVTLAPIKIPSKKKKDSRSYTLWSSARASCQSLKEISINTYQSSRFDISSVLCFVAYWGFDVLLGKFDMEENPTEELHILHFVFLWLVVFVSAQLLWHAMYYGMSLAKQKPKSKYNIVKVSFGVCTILFVLYETDLLLVTVLNLLLWRGIANGISWLGLEKISKSKNEERKRKNVDIDKSSCLGSVEKQTIYTTPASMYKLTGRQGKRKIKEVICKSGVDDIKIKTSDNSVSLIGSGKSVQNAIGLIQEAIGKGGIRMIDLPSSLQNQTALAPTLSDRITNFLYRWSEGGEAERVPNRNADVPVESETAGLVDVSNDSLDKGGNGSNNTSETPVQRETINNNANNKTKEATAVESPPVKEVRKEEIPSEIGIDSCQGMTTRETITEASISSLNDRSNVSKAYSNFTLNEDDPLLIFLRSQESCIKGSVDEFYTWLVKSEDIDSMLALKEAVNEDDYLNDMKVGDGGGSGVKGFKRKAFLRAISEYFNDESDTKSTAEEHQSLPQCQKKDLSETLEPPEELVCPISLSLMTNDPVVAADGITYERASIEDWFKKSKAKICKAQENLKQNPHSESDRRVVNNGVCSPVYGSKLENLTLVSITVVRNMARAFEEKKEAGS